jgi:hypothetical protein
VYILDVLNLAENLGNDSVPPDQPACLPLYLLLQTSHNMRWKLLGSVSTRFLRLPLNMSWVYATVMPELRVDGHRCGAVTNPLTIML